MAPNQPLARPAKKLPLTRIVLGVLGVLLIGTVLWVRHWLRQAEAIFNMPVGASLPRSGTPQNAITPSYPAMTQTVSPLSEPPATARPPVASPDQGVSPAAAEAETKALSQAMHTPLALSGANATPPRDDVFEGLISPDMLKKLMSESVTEGGVDMKRVQDFVEQLTPQQKAVLENALKNPQAVGLALQNAAKSSQN